MMTMKNPILELETVLKTHAARYPLMQPTDAVKLIYQNEFGGGHMIANEQACLDYLRKEYERVTKDSQMEPYENIGNGIDRVKLAALKEEHLEQLGRAFIRSAATHTGSLERFLQKLEVLRQITKQGCFSFDIAELEKYLIEYAKANYPAVSHSEVYRNAYRPAYRVVLKDLLSECF